MKRIKKTIDEIPSKRFKSQNDVDVVLSDEGKSTKSKLKQLTKAQCKEKRIKDNKVWKTQSRYYGSGVDPNPRHTLYYKQQLPFLQDGHEWEQFQTTMCQPLQLTFRLGSNSFGSYHKLLKHHIEQKFILNNADKDMECRDSDKAIVKTITWCPAYQAAIDSKAFTDVVRGDSTTHFPNELTANTLTVMSSLHQFLSREVSLGNIVRQELVSMIPVILLNISSYHKVLDICSAPGSKTEQIIKAMQSSALSNRFDGLVVANDVDPIRVQKLSNRLERDGKNPSLLIYCARAEDLASHINVYNSSISSRDKAKPFKFDRIVCDVPCSGDGTLRKCPHLWRLFRPRLALEVHKLQRQILLSACSMLSTDGNGYMVYSTCSLNPLENESVVASVLQDYGGRLELVDITSFDFATMNPIDDSSNISPSLQHIHSLITNLQWRPGVSTWQCSEDIFTIGEENKHATNTSKQKLPKLCKSMFPPKRAVMEALHLERCMRVMPHDQDTGGFFIALLHMVPSTPNIASTFHTKLSPQAAIAVEPEVDSTKVLKPFGYNPKVLRCHTSGLETNQQEACKYHDVDQRIFDSACETFSFNDAQNVLRIQSSMTPDLNSTDSKILCYAVTTQNPSQQNLLFRRSLPVTSKTTKNAPKISSFQHTEAWRRLVGDAQKPVAAVFSSDDVTLVEEPVVMHVVSRHVKLALNTWVRHEHLTQAGVDVASARADEDGVLVWSVSDHVDHLKYLMTLASEQNISVCSSCSDFLAIVALSLDIINSSVEVVSENTGAKCNFCLNKSNDGVIELSMQTSVHSLSTDLNSQTSLEFKKELWRLCSNRAEVVGHQSSFIVLISIDFTFRDTDMTFSENNTTISNSRVPRLSKAQRKKVKSDPSVLSSIQPSRNTSESDSYSTLRSSLAVGPKEFVLAFSVTVLPMQCDKDSSDMESTKQYTFSLALLSPTDLLDSYYNCLKMI